MRWILSTLVILALMVPPAVAQVPIGPMEGRNQVITTGQGQVEVTPDQAIVTVGAQIQRPSANEAWTETSRIGNQILARLQQIGVRKEQLRTSGVQLFPTYARVDPGVPSQPTSYRGTYTVIVTLDEMNLIGRVLDASVEAGANTVFGISFGLKDVSKARKEALAKAVREAREKADAIAQAAGLQLHGIERILESNIFVQPPFARGQVAVPVPAPIQIEPGIVTVSAQVTVVFGF